MFIVVHHTIADPERAFARGENLLAGNGAPPAVRVREFYPSRDKADVYCLWEGTSLEQVRDYVDATMGHTSERRTSRSTRRSPAGFQSSRPAAPRR